MAAATAVIASSSGTLAATSAPKATIRMMIVIGSEVISARLKSSSKAFDSALSALASPNCSTRNVGWSRWTAATALSALPTRSSALSPAISKFTRAERPSFETCPSLPLAYGLSMSFTYFVCWSRPITSDTAALDSASRALPPFLGCTSTLSFASSGNERLIAASARPDSPVP